MSEERAVNLLKDNLSPGLFAHCAGVAETAAGLARKMGCDESRARLAGLLHDCARDMDPSVLLRLARKHGIEIDDYTRLYPVLLHAPLGAVRASEWGFTDEVVLYAISDHTLGKPSMSLLSQIVYVADKIEPGRTYPGVNELRQAVDEDFHNGIIEIVAHSVRYLLSGKKFVHPLTITFWNWLMEEFGQRELTR